MSKTYNMYILNIFLKHCCAVWAATCLYLNLSSNDFQEKV